MAKTSESSRSGHTPRWAGYLLEALMVACREVRTPHGSARSAWAGLQVRLSKARADSFLEWMRGWQGCVSQTGRVPVHADLSEALYRAETATWLPNVVVLWEMIQTGLRGRDDRMV